MNEIRIALESWRGCSARLWSFTSSHNMAIIRLHRVGVRGNLHLIVSGVKEIGCPTSWMNATLTVEQVGEDIVLQDAAAIVRILGSSIRIDKDVAPV